MNKISNYLKNMSSFVIMPIFVWLGFVCAISFMEAWLKFQAPNLSLSTGLEVGKIVFAALNKVEGFLALVVFIFVYFERKKINYSKIICFTIPIFILIVQTFFLMPHLNKRAEALTKGLEITHSYVHFYYIALEGIKVIFLFILGIYELIRLSISQNDLSNKSTNLM